MSALVRPAARASSAALLEFLLTRATLRSLALVPSCSQGPRSTSTPLAEVRWLSLTVLVLGSRAMPSRDCRRLGEVGVSVVTAGGHSREEVEEDRVATEADKMDILKCFSMTLAVFSFFSHLGLALVSWSLLLLICSGCISCLLLSGGS